MRARFGGRLQMVISGSAALSMEVAELIDALGIPVYEGYGLSETSPVVSANTPRHRKLGSVGRVLPGVRVVIDERLGERPGEGEIIVYGPNVMRGYHNRPEENAAAFTSDGGFRTGDLGHVDQEGYLFITGRIKEQYKLENGKYVMPGVIEEELKLSPLVANAMIYGDGRPYNIALVVPDGAALADRAEARGPRARRSRPRPEGARAAPGGDGGPARRVPGLRGAAQGPGHRRGLHDGERAAHADDEAQAAGAPHALSPRHRRALRGWRGGARPPRAVMAQQQPLTTASPRARARSPSAGSRWCPRRCA
ncbi:MAG: AMP-binding protein [Sandaracinaceae bacterium]|nr:AMP-binding protein [Sandaracinaceae bacterium]